MLATLNFPKLGECRNEDGEVSYLLYSSLFLIQSFLVVFSLFLGVVIGFFLVVVPWFTLLIVVEMMFGWEVPFKLLGFLLMFASWVGIAIYCTVHFSRDL